MSQAISFRNQTIYFYKDASIPQFTLCIEVEDYESASRITREINMAETVRLRDYLNQLIEDDNPTQTPILPS